MSLLSIIIPTKNEASNIGKLFKEISKIKNRLKDYEIIIVDSKSEDNTQLIAKKSAREYGLKVRVFDTNNLDLSNSVVFGFKKAKGKIICVMDADLQHPAKMLPLMLNTLERKKIDILIASRFVKGSKINFSLWRKFVSKVFIFLAHLFIPKTSNIKDPSSGFFMFKKKILKNVKLNPIGFKILLEILAKAHYNNFLEIPFLFSERKKGKSKFNFKQVVVAFNHLLRLAKYKKEYKRFLKFCIVGISGVIVNEGLLWLLTEFLGIFYLISGILSIEASILSNFILNDLWTFRNERKGKFLERLFRFNIARIFALGINFIILWGLTEIGVYYLISNLIGITIATIFTYTTSLQWVWK